VEGDVSKVAVSLAVVQVHDLKYTLRLLQQHIGFFVLVLLDELEGNVGEFKQEEGDFVLVYFDFFVV
jgi:hypothetical protein